MGYPVVLGFSGDNSGGNVTTTTVDVAALVGTPDQGDLVIILIAKDGTGTFTWPATPAFTVWMAGTAFTSALFEVRARIWLNGDSTSVAITHASESTAWQVYRIQVGTYAAAALAAAPATDGTGSANPNPPSCNPTWSSAFEVLWIALCANDGNVAVTGAPADFTNLRNDRVAASTGSGIASARRELIQDSLDPGTFTMASEQWGAETIALLGSMTIDQNETVANTDVIAKAVVTPLIVDYNDDVGVVDEPNVVAAGGTLSVNKFETAGIADVLASLAVTPLIVNLPQFVFVTPGTGAGDFSTVAVTPLVVNLFDTIAPGQGGDRDVAFVAVDPLVAIVFNDIVSADVLAKLVVDPLAVNRFESIYSEPQAPHDFINVVVTPLVRVAVETLSVTEDETVQTSGAAAIVVDTFDTLAVSEAKAVAVDPLVAKVFDQLTVTEDKTVSLSGAAALIVDTFDALTVTEFRSVVVTPILANVFEPTTVADVKSVAVTPLVANVFEAMSVTDVKTAVVTPLTVISFDPVTITEFPSFTFVGGALLVDVFETLRCDDTRTATRVPIVLRTGRRGRVTLEFITSGPLAVNVFDSASILDVTTDALTPLIVSAFQALTVSEFEFGVVDPLAVAKFDAIAVTDFDVVLIGVNQITIDVFETLHARDERTPSRIPLVFRTGRRGLVTIQLTTAALLTVNVFDASAVADVNVAAVTPLVANVFQTLSVTDQQAVAVTPLVVAQFQTIAATDVASLSVSHLVVSAFNAITVTDDQVVTVLVGVLVNVFDTTTVTDVAASYVTPLLATTFESLSVVDVTTAAVTPLLVSQFDVLTVTDVPTVTILTGVIIVTSETLSVADVSFNALTALILSFEPITVVDVKTAALTPLLVATFDQLAIADVPTIVIITGVLVSAFELAGVTDFTVAAVTPLVVSQQDLLTVDESMITVVDMLVVAMFQLLSVEDSSTQVMSGGPLLGVNAYDSIAMIDSSLLVVNPLIVFYFDLVSIAEVGTEALVDFGFFFNERFTETVPDGYDMAWSDSPVVGTGNIFDPNANSAEAGSPVGWGNECLKIAITNVDDPTAYREHFFYTPLRRLFMRFDVLVSPEALDDGDFVRVFSAAPPGIMLFYIQQTVGVLEFWLYQYASGSGTSHYYSPVAAGQSYKVELKWDLVGHQWAWRVDNVVVASGSITDPNPLPVAGVRVGTNVVEAIDSIFYFDNIAFGTENYPPSDINLQMSDLLTVFDFSNVSLTPLLLEVFDSLAMTDFSNAAVTPLLVALADALSVLDAPTAAVDPLLVFVFDTLAITDVAARAIPTFFVTFDYETLARVALTLATTAAVAVAISYRPRVSLHQVFNEGAGMLYLDNDNLVTLENVLDRKTGNYLNAAVINAKLDTRGGANVIPDTVVPKVVGDATGKYEVTWDQALLDGHEPGMYRLTIIGSEAGIDFGVRTLVEVDYRTLG